MKKAKLHYTLLTILNLIAIPITLYLVYMHFKPDASTICNVSEGFNCDIVNKSKYSTFLGIPVAIMGFVTYLILLGFSIRGFFKDQTKLVPYLTLFVAAGTAFSLYLTAIEAFVLLTFCLFCVAQQIIILAQLGLFSHLWKLTSSK